MTVALPYVIPAQAGIQNDGTRPCQPAGATKLELIGSFNPEWTDLYDVLNR